MHQFIMESERFFLREFTLNDLDDLKVILQDPEVMYAYEAPFSNEKVESWLLWLLKSYQNHQFGLWAIIDKKQKKIVGQCGIVYSEVEEQQLLEIGYLLKKECWGQGYASEAALLCKAYAKNILQADAIHSIIRTTNQSSINVAKKMGMTPYYHYDKSYSGTPVPHTVYRVELM